MNEEMNMVNVDEENIEVTDDNGVYELVEDDGSSNAKAVAIGATAAALVTAGLYGAYKLGVKAKAAWDRRKLKKAAEEEIEKARAFDQYDDAVNAIHEEQETE